MAGPGLPMSEVTAAQMRDSDRSVLMLQDGPASLHSVSDIAIPGLSSPIPARVYRPRVGALHVMVFYPGGGFVIGPETYDAPLRALALNADVLIVAPAYRLAPEHPYPAAVDDAVAVAHWATEQASSIGGNSSAIGIAGDSSGGNLAAVVTHQLARQGTPPLFQALIYPMLDATTSSTTYGEFAEGFGFTTAKAHWYLDQYLPEHVDRRDPRASPLFDSELDRVPHTLVAVAECDPLRGDGQRYATMLQRVGVSVDYICYAGMIHGFFQMTAAVSESRRLHRHLAEWIRSAVDEIS